MSKSLIIGIVDDDPDVRGSLDSLMRSVGFAARSFSSAEELLACHAHDALACIVTDLHMPGMTGLELQTEMQSRGWRTPVILMTAYPTPASRDLANERGAVAFLTKPLDPDILLAAIESATA